MSDPRRVLVVDDEADLRHFVSQVLSTKGYTVVEATNGAEALNLIAEAPPDLIILDLMMPVLDGWGVLDYLHLRQVPVPVIVLSAFIEPARLKALDARIVGFLSKPFRIPELIQMCENALT